MPEAMYTQRFVSDPALLERFDRQIEDETERLKDYVRQAVHEPICSLAFLYVDEDEAAFSYAYAWTERARGAVLARSAEDVSRVWQPADWDIDLDLGEPEPETARGAAELAAALRAGLGEQPAKPFLLDLCAHLNRIDWTGVAQVTTDFVAWSNDHELYSLTPKTFRAIATEDAANAYEQRGWLDWLAGNSLEDGF